MASSHAGGARRQPIDRTVQFVDNARMLSRPLPMLALALGVQPTSIVVDEAASQADVIACGAGD